MLLIISVVLTVIPFVSFYYALFNQDHEVIWLICLICLLGGIISGVVAICCIVFFIGSHSEYCKKADRIKLEQQRAAIIYCLEESPESVVGLASDISEYNTTIITGRLRHSNPWFSNITYDFYDDLELIEVGEKE